MRKAFLFSVAIVLLGACATRAWAYSGSVTAPSGQTIYYNYNSSSQTIVITCPSPSSYADTWANYPKPTGVLVIPDSITHNGTTYPVISIGNWAFLGCSGLTSVTIPNSVTSINSSFYDCSGLTSIIISNSVTSIGASAFHGCSGLTSVTIPNSVTLIGNNAFKNCSGLTSITIPNSVTSIGSDAFEYCSSLTSVSIPNSITSISDYTFSGCSSMTSVSIPNSVTSIGRAAFRNCIGLTSVTIPNSVTSIGQSAFALCSGLTSVTIPNSVTSIGNNAFYDCSSLTSVTIPNSVTNIGDNAFYNCNNLTEIHSGASVAPQLGSNSFANVPTTIPIYIPCGSSLSYYSRWSYFSNFIEEAASTFTATSDNEQWGTVQIFVMPTCTSPQAVFYASANSGYHFDHWSDGNTDNPRTLTLTSDSVIIGYFSVASPDTVFIHDTVWIHDTIYLYDTVYITEEGIGDVEALNTKVYSSHGQIVVEGADGNQVTLYDVTGRVLATKQDHYTPLRFDAPASGTYMIKIGNHPARRVVVIR